MESCKSIDTIEEAENAARCVAMGGHENLIFKSSSIKEQFFNTIDILRGHDVNIINCNSSFDRFEKSLFEANSNLIIYNNVNKCSDLNILNIVKENNGILIC